MELSESQESENSNNTRIEFIDTSNSDNKGDLGGSWDIDLSSGLGVSSGIDFGFLRFSIVGFILLDSLKEFLTLGLIIGSTFLSLLFKSGCDFLISLFLLLLSFGFWGNFLFCLHLPQSKNNIKLILFYKISIRLCYNRSVQIIKFL